MPSQHTAIPSTPTTGFIQRAPTLGPQFPSDGALARIFASYLGPSTQSRTEPILRTFSAELVSPAIASHVANAEQFLPTLRPATDAWGNPQPAHQTLQTSEGWRALKDVGARAGIVALPYENEYGAESRVVQALMIMLWTGSGANVGCPEAMSDGAAALLRDVVASEKGGGGERGDALRTAYERLVSRDPERVWRSGQWMTERAGGSDVRGTETLADLSAEANDGREDLSGKKLGPWEVSGFKFFSSATDADVAILLARTPSSDGDGAISAFFAPLQRHTTTTAATGQGAVMVESNGVRIHRLKNKFGTKPLPTAELTLDRTRAWLLGEQGKGTRIMGTVLNITRLYTALSAIGYWGRGLAVAKAYAEVREVSGKVVAGKRLGGRLLKDVPAHIKGLANGVVEYTAGCQMVAFVAALLGIVENASSSLPTGSSALALRGLDPAAANHLYRLLAPVIKTTCSRAAMSGLRLCMEFLGGVGYLEEAPPLVSIPRLLRDAAVLPIWEGTGDILAADVVRVVKGRGGKDVLNVLGAWVESKLDACQMSQNHVDLVGNIWRRWVHKVQTEQEDELKFRGIDVVEELAWVVSAILLALDARRDENTVAQEITKRWLQKKLPNLESSGHWKEEAAWDRRVVFGDSDASQLARL